MVGVDEVGRGCLAGPLLVVAAQTNQNLPESIRDSKLLTSAEREKAFILLSNLCQYGEGWVSCSEIDNLGLAQALRLGFKRALNNLNIESRESIIIDGPINYAPNKYKNIRTLIDADRLVPIVSAASIIAKVKRDIYMKELAKKHPYYSFETNVGYGTTKHLQALREFGPTKLVHRMSFSPIRQTALW